MDTEDSKLKRLPFEEYNQRESQFVVRGLQLLNGGGAIALFAFLGQIWGDYVELRDPIMNSILIMLVGLVLTTWSAIIRLRGMDWWTKSRPRHGFFKIFITHKLYIPLRTLSFILFIVSVVYLITSLKLLST